MDLLIRLGVVLFLLLSATSTTFAGSTVGVDYYGHLASSLPAPSKVVQLVRSLGVSKIRIYDTDSSILQAFANTGIELMVSAPNYEIPALAANVSAAYTWVNTSILHFYPQTRITTIVIGNEVLTGAEEHIVHRLLPAMQNVYSALEILGMDSLVKVSTTHALRLLNVSFPPSLGSFNRQEVVKRILEFLSRTGAPFLVNIYPFYTFQQDRGRNFPESYALLNPTGFVVVDPISRLRYENLFEAQLDTVYAAIDALGFDDIQVVVSETGWPSSGKTGASVRNARSYNQNIARHCLSGVGTPLLRQRPIEAFIFNLFSEPGNEALGGNFGLFYPNGSKVYDFDLQSLLLEGDYDD